VDTELDLVDQSAAPGENATNGRTRAEVAAELRTLSKEKMVTGSIPEPAYYAEFRDIHANSVL